jgi:hypothetical protein
MVDVRKLDFPHNSDFYIPDIADRLIFNFIHSCYKRYIIDDPSNVIHFKREEPTVFINKVHGIGIILGKYTMGHYIYRIPYLIRYAVIHDNDESQTLKHEKLVYQRFPDDNKDFILQSDTFNTLSRMRIFSPLVLLADDNPPFLSKTGPNTKRMYI